MAKETIGRIGNCLYLTPREAELIACLINNAVNNQVSLSEDETDFAKVVADYFGGIKAYARLTAERI